jgi:hypothetical protein
VTDATGVKNATLYYKLASGLWQTMNMESSGALYSAVIPGADYAKMISFYIVAYDVYGQSRSYGSAQSPDGYVVGDSVDPSIAVTGPPSQSKLIGVVRFNITASDSGSGIDNLTVLVDGVRVDVSTITPWSFDWNTFSVTNAQHTVEFRAFDKAGNMASVVIVYQVENPQGIDAVGYALQGFMSQYGFFVGVGAVVLLLLVARLFVRRRAK